MVAKSCSISRSVRAEVGSSITSSRGSRERAFATSTICCWAIPRPLTFSRGSMSTPSSPRSPWASRCRRARSITPAPSTGSRPRKMFSAAESWGIKVSSWYMVRMPRACAWRGPSISTGRPSRRISPASFAVAPLSTFMRVDLPAPFSPRSTCTSPRRTSKSTPSRATTPGNAFRIPSMVTAGGASTPTPAARGRGAGRSTPAPRAGARGRCAGAGSAPARPAPGG